MTFQKRRAGPKRSCLLRRHRGRRLDGWVWRCWGPSCYKLENAEASKDVFRHQKSKRQFHFWREGQHNTLKEINHKQVSEQKRFAVLRPCSLQESFVIVHLWFLSKNTMWNFRTRRGRWRRFVRTAWDSNCTGFVKGRAIDRDFQCDLTNLCLLTEPRRVFDTVIRWFFCWTGEPAFLSILTVLQAPSFCSIISERSQKNSRRVPGFSSALRCFSLISCPSYRS